MPTGNPDTWGEEQIAPKKWGKSSKSTFDNPDVPSILDTVNRTVDTRSYEEKRKDWETSKLIDVRTKVDSMVYSGKIPLSADPYDPWSSDVLGSWVYALDTPVLNWLGYGGSIKESRIMASDKWTPTELVDAKRYEKLRNIETGKEPFPKNKVFARKIGVHTFEDWMAYGRSERLKFESKEETISRASTWRHIFIDTALGASTYIPAYWPGKIVKGADWVLFSGTKGNEFKRLLQSMSRDSMTKIRGAKAATIDPFAESIGTKLVNLKTRITTTKAQRAANKEVSDMRYVAKIDLLWNRENILKPEMESLRSWMQADGVDEEAITIWFQDPTKREYLARANPKIPQYAERFARINAMVAKDEQAWKALQNTISNDNYLHRTLTTEAMDRMNARMLSPELKDIRNSASIARTEEEFYAKDKAYFSMTERLYGKGEHLYNMDAIISQTTRTQLYLESEAAVGILNEIARTKGVSIKNMPPTGYDTSIPFFADQGLAIPTITANSLRGSKQIEPYLQGDTSTLRQGLRAVGWAKDKLLWANAGITHLAEKINTIAYPAYYFANEVGGKVQQYWSMGIKALDPRSPAEYILYASSKTKLAANGQRIFTTSPSGKIITFEDAAKVMERNGYEIVNLQGMSTTSDPITSVLSAGGRKGQAEIQWSTLRYAMTHFEEDEAIKFVNKYQGNFHTILGKHEQTLADNFMFYKWNKFITPLTIDTMLNHPARITATWRISDATWNQPEAQILKPYLPPHMANPFFLGGNDMEYFNWNVPPNTLVENLKAINETIGGDPGGFATTPQLSLLYAARTGKDRYFKSNVTDLSSYAWTSMFGRPTQLAKYMTSDRSPAKKALYLATGIDIKSGTELLLYSNFLDKTNEKVVNNSIRRVSGSFRGCGF